jgi:hypothetical protein
VVSERSAITRRVGWTAVGLAALTVAGLAVVVMARGAEQDRLPPGLTESQRCQPMTAEPKIVPATDPFGTQMDAEMIVVAASKSPVNRGTQFAFHYTRADGADSQKERDELLGSGYQTAPYLGQEDSEYDLGLIPTVQVPGYREAVVSRTRFVANEDTGYTDVWAAICGTVGFTVEPDGSLSGARLVDNPDAGTFRYSGQLR